MAIVITGIGSVSAAGSSFEELAQTLLAGRSCLATCDDPHLPLAARLPVAAVTSRLPTGPRTVGLGEVAAREALQQSGIARSDLGLALGSCTGGLHASESSYLNDGPQHISDVYRDQPVGRTLAQLRSRLRLHGPATAHAEACASTAGALIEAIEWIRSGQLTAALVIGADALTRLTMAGFSALQIVDPLGCRPFSVERAGMSLGEGAVALVIEDEAHAHARGARVIARLLGWGLAGDAHHATAPDPTGTWLGAAIDQALADGQVTAVDFISAHGTGTRDNDASEALVLASRFGQIPVCSTKRAIGHTMGASAGFGLAGAVIALQRQLLLPTAAWTGTPVDGIEVVTSARPAVVRTAMTTCLAFGGVNTAFVIGAA